MRKSKKKRKKLYFYSMEQKVICKKCKKVHVISYKHDTVWEDGVVKCHCGNIVKFDNDRIESLYI